MYLFAGTVLVWFVSSLGFFSHICFFYYLLGNKKKVDAFQPEIFNYTHQRNLIEKHFATTVRRRVYSSCMRSARTFSLLTIYFQCLTFVTRNSARSSFALPPRQQTPLYFFFKRFFFFFLFLVNGRKFRRRAPAALSIRN